MKKEIQKFNNSQFGNLEILIVDGVEYFPATDSAKMLGYANPQKAIRDHCKGVNEIVTPTKGGQQKKNYITEGNLYRLIINSKLPQAEKFESWVFDEVLPQIRKHGAYMTDDTLEKALTSPDFLIQLATKLKDEKAKNKVLEEENAKQKQRIGELEPKADYTDLILKSKSIVAVTQIAKDYGMSAQEMNNKLHELKVQYLVGKQWILYAKYQAKGYTHSETIPIKHKDGRADVSMITKWTQKGRLFIYDLLKANGILPMIEREVA